MHQKEKMEWLGEMLNCHQLFLWELSRELELINSTSPDPEFFLYSLVISNGNTLRRQFEKESEGTALFLSDSLNLCWMVIPIYSKHVLETIWAIGPVFTSSISEMGLEQRLRRQSMPVKWSARFKEKIATLPVISIEQMERYAAMLYRCLNGKQHLKLWCCTVVSDHKENSAENQIPFKNHGTYASEQILFNTIKEGNLEALKKLPATGNIGTLSHNDPVRACKNQGIALVTLATRAVVDGGMPEETAYNLGDQTIVAIEETKTVSETRHIMQEFVEDIVSRMYSIRKGEVKDADILACYAYVEAHLDERIDHDLLAKSVGYSRNYLATRFKEKTGLTLSEMVNNCKVKHAKILLIRSNISVQDLSEQLCFSSPSYFTKVFREVTGLAPKEYRTTNERTDN